MYVARGRNINASFKVTILERCVAILVCSLERSDANLMRAGYRHRTVDKCTIADFRIYSIAAEKTCVKILVVSLYFHRTIVKGQILDFTAHHFVNKTTKAESYGDVFRDRDIQIRNSVMVSVNYTFD